MSQETNETVESQKMTEAEIAKEMADSAKFYEEHIPYLQKIREYEVLKADIAEARLRSRMIKMKEAELVSQADLASANNMEINKRK